MTEPYTRIRDFFYENNLDIDFEYRGYDRKPWHALIGEIGKKKTSLIMIKDHEKSNGFMAVMTGAENAGASLRLLAKEIAGKCLVLNYAAKDSAYLSIPKNLIT